MRHTRSTSHDAKRRAQQVYRAYYSTPQWKATRKRQLSLFPLCAPCNERGVVTAATVCHHVDASSKHSWDSFFAGPFMSSCKPCHDQLGQIEDKRGYSPQVGSDGYPTDSRHPFNRQG